MSSFESKRHGRKMPEPQNLNLLRQQVEKFVEHEAFSQLADCARHLCGGWNDACRTIWVWLNGVLPIDVDKILQTVVRVVVEILN
jgi:hypothetical protein